MSAVARERLASIGLAEWLRVGDREAVEALVEDLRALGVRRLRTQVSRADWHTPEGQAWYAWLLPRLAGECELLPCLCHSAPARDVGGSASGGAKGYADFVDDVVGRFGAHFGWVELWDESAADGRADGDPMAALGEAAQRARHRGSKVVLGGIRPDAADALAAARGGVLRHVDAIGLRRAEGGGGQGGWISLLDGVRRALQAHGASPQVWLTEAGHSTWRHDGIEQLRQLRAVLDVPVDRVYWYAARDQSTARPDSGADVDERQAQFGLRDAFGRPKLLYRIWAQEGFEGIDGLANLPREGGAATGHPARGAGPAWPTDASHGEPAGEAGAERPHKSAPRPSLVHPTAGDPGSPVPAPRAARAPAVAPADERPVLITGGAGFIGTNLAARLLADGRHVLVYDNLSRPGVEHNLRWLREQHGERLQVAVADVRDARLLRDAVAQASRVFHLAAQVAVTSSLDDPMMDFEVNLRGTLNLLEAIRAARRPPPLLFTSTNKVYGALDDVALDATDSRYQPRDRHLRETGIGETRPLDFHSPYGCSKGGADQYVLDYARSYGLPAAVFRMSCIYGPHQFGNEDQGWVAHFLIRALEGRPITLYGDGLQVRDILFVEDLVEAMLLCQASMPALAGRAFNIGGGPANTVSLVELLAQIGRLAGQAPALSRSDWRTGDQRYYVSDTRAFCAATGWAPQVAAADGVERLFGWLQSQRPAAGASGEAGALRVAGSNAA